MNWIGKRLSDLVEVYRDHSILAGLATVGTLYLTCKTLRVLSRIWKQFLRPSTNVYKCYGTPNSWAIITGGSSGIGLAYAKLLAKAGFNLLLIARDGTKLELMKAEIQKEVTTHACMVETLRFDFNKPYTETGYADLTKAIEGKDISILVNNVGTDHACGFEEFTPEGLSEMINVNVNTTTFMTWLLVPRMLARKQRSAIINVSSAFTEAYVPNFQMYAATKAYMNVLMRYLHEELKGKGIDVLTGLTGETITPRNSMSSRWHDTAETVARKQIADVGKGAVTFGSFRHFAYAQYLQSCMSSEYRTGVGATCRNLTLKEFKKAS